MTPAEGHPEDDWQFIGPEDFREADYDPSKWLDPETGQITDRTEMLFQVVTLLDRQQYDTVLELAAERLAVTEDPLERLQYTTWLAQAADEQGDHRLSVFHLESIRDSGILFQDAASRALEVGPRLKLGDFEDAREAIRKAFELYRRSDDMGEWDLIDDEFEPPMRSMMESMLIEAEIKWLEYLTEHKLTDELRVTAEGRLVDPVPGEARHLYRALAICETITGDHAAALRYVRAGERSAAEAGFPLDAARFAASEVKFSLDHFQGLSARDAYNRSGNHLKTYLDQPDVDPLEASSLFHELQALRHRIPRGGLILGR